MKCPSVVLPITLQVPDLPAYIQSITARVLLSILLSLPYQPSSSISHDSCLKSRIIEKVENACIRFAVGSSSVMSQILPLVIDVVSNKEQVSYLLLGLGTNGLCILYDSRRHRKSGRCLILCFILDYPHYPGVSLL